MGTSYIYLLLVLQKVLNVRSCLM